MAYPLWGDCATPTNFLRCCRSCYLVTWWILKHLLGLAGWRALLKKEFFLHWTVVCNQLAWRTDCYPRWIQFELLAGFEAVRALASSTRNLENGNLFFLTKILPSRICLHTCNNSGVQLLGMVFGRCCIQAKFCGPEALPLASPRTFAQVLRTLQPANWTLKIDVDLDAFYQVGFKIMFYSSKLTGVSSDEITPRSSTGHTLMGLDCLSVHGLFAHFFGTLQPPNLSLKIDVTLLHFDGTITNRKEIGLGRLLPSWFQDDIFTLQVQVNRRELWRSLTRAF